MSYRNADAPEIVGGVTRTLAVAKASCESWAWQWFESLTKAQQESLGDSSGSHERPAKKQRV